MKHKIMGLLLIATFITGKTYAQLDSFDLSSYKLPVLKRKTLETRFNLSGGNHYLRQPDYAPYSSIKSWNDQYWGNFQSNYTSYVNTASSQKSMNAGVSLTSNFSNLKNDHVVTGKSYDLSPTINCNSVNRKYYRTKRFFESDIMFNYNYDKYHSYSMSGTPYDTTEQTSNSKTQSFSGVLPIKVGIGRIEPVNDARQAVYIFKELAKQKRVSPDKKDSDIIQFAELISKLKNERFFDSRIKRIHELEALDSFLIANNYVLDHDSRYFTTLSDFWDYGGQPLRSSGTRISAAFYPEYYFHGDNTTYELNPGNILDKNNSSLNIGVLDAGLELDREKPINLYWQNSIELHALAGIILSKNRDKPDSTLNNKFNIPNLQLGFQQKIGFYPNTRTSIEYTYSLEYIQLFDNSNAASGIFGVTGKGFRVLSGLSLNYYISPKFRLNVASEVYYIWQKLKDRSSINFINLLWNNSGTLNPYYSNSFLAKEFDNNFNVSLIYSMF